MKRPIIRWLGIALLALVLWLLAPAPAPAAPGDAPRTLRYVADPYMVRAEWDLTDPLRQLDMSVTWSDGTTGEEFSTTQISPTVNLAGGTRYFFHRIVAGWPNTATYTITETLLDGTTRTYTFTPRRAYLPLLRGAQ